MENDNDNVDLDANLTPLQRRLIDAAVDVQQCAPETPEFLHAVLCQVGLPRSRTTERFFERSNGRVSIAIEAGRLMKAGSFVEMPMPYGAKPRLALMHISSEAVRTKSRNINIFSSVREFLLSLGLQTDGRSYAEMRRQMENLAACNMLLGISSERKDITISTKPIEHFEAWISSDDIQQNMWPGYLELSDKFYETLLAHAVPLDPRAISGLKKSALALDVYTWLAHRLCRIRTDDGVKISWKNLKEQFGQEYKDTKDFKKKFKAALTKVYRVYPDAKMGYEAGGMLLYPSKPPVPKTQVVVELPKQQAET